MKLIYLQLLPKPISWFISMMKMGCQRPKNNGNVEKKTQENVFFSLIVMQLKSQGNILQQEYHVYSKK